VKLAVLYQQYDPMKYGPALDRLREYLDPIPFCNKTYFVIDNKAEGSEVQQTGEWTYAVGGDNSLREFSAWQRGLEVLQRWGDNFQSVLLCNEAFLAPGECYVKDYAWSATLRSRFLISAVGRIDTYHEPIQALGYDVSKWLCTNCVFLPGRVVRRLDSVVSVDNKAIDIFVPREYDPAYFRPDAPISARYKELIVEWLTVRWHSAFVINDATWQLFRTKVQAILNEALLTAKLRACGFAIRSYGRKKYY
jgi:hypothetical protein